MSWRDEAACKGEPSSLFFLETIGPGVGADAKAICAGCPVRAECLDYALEHGEQHGVWGGLTAKERSWLNGAELRIGRCKRCEQPFTFMWVKGKRPRYCSEEHLRADRLEWRRAYKARYRNRSEAVENVG